MRIADVLACKSGAVITIAPNAQVVTAISALAENNIGAVPVCGADEVMVGILSERDVVRELMTRGRSFLDLKINDVMTTNVFTCSPEDDTSYAMEVMQANRFRHIPVVENGRPIAMISTRDLMGAVLEETVEQRRTLAVAYEMMR